MLQGISFNTEMPMIFKRKDAKSHGTKKIIEGVYNKNDRCLIVDDVMTSGISILETVEVKIAYFQMYFKFSYFFYKEFKK